MCCEGSGLSTDCLITVKRIAQRRLDFALLALIAIVCTVLSLLQYHWVSELSRADQVRLRSGLKEQVLRLVRAFDERIGESCTALLPTATEIGDEGSLEAHRSRYRRWVASHNPAMFSRIGMAVPEKGRLQLYGIDVQGRISPMEWPHEWECLQAEMTARMHGAGPPPSVPPRSTLIEMPVFDGPMDRRGPRPELEWMIFDLSEDYLRQQMLPRLVEESLSSSKEAVYDVSVSWPGSPGRVIYSTRPDRSSVSTGADLTTGIFSIRVSAPPARHGRHSGDENSRPRWVLAVRHRGGSLDAAVSRVQRENLVTSILLIGLLGGAAWALVQYTARSRRLADMQLRFTAGVSHDLRTPLTAIRGAAFNIADGVVHEPEATKRYANLILRNSEELTWMIENVLAFSASRHSRAGARREVFAIRDLLEHATAAIAQEAEQAGCRIELKVPSDLPRMSGDAVALELAFRNLIGNAVRHGADGRWVGVSAAGSPNGVEIRVCDRGPGIPETEHKRIFEPFYRTEQTRATQVRGTGLGLSLVKDTVERHGGTIEVRNASSGGAQFTVRLPSKPDAL
jgi:signal transduction histidine kinase